MGQLDRAARGRAQRRAPCGGGGGSPRRARPLIPSKPRPLPSCTPPTVFCERLPGAGANVGQSASAADCKTRPLSRTGCCPRSSEARKNSVLPGRMVSGPVFHRRGRENVSGCQAQGSGWASIRGILGPGSQTVGPCGRARSSLSLAYPYPSPPAAHWLSLTTEITDGEMPC
jgi:hypothetical protein